MTTMKTVRVTVLLALLAVTAAANPNDDELLLPDLQGQKHSLSEYRGKVTVINFWATWCGPCKHEMPLFSDAAKKYGADRLQVVAISLDNESTRKNIAAFAEKEKMSFPILLGTTEDMKTLGLGEGLPATAFVDQNGQIVARVLGEIGKSELKDRVEWLLNGKSGKSPAALVNNMNKKHDDGFVPVMH
jgi:thiol-disulfide isomerase/thioredoxin